MKGLKERLITKIIEDYEDSMLDLGEQVNITRLRRVLTKNLDKAISFEPLREWASKRGLLSASPEKQFIKLLEEVGELAEALLKKEKASIIDAIGDCIVVLTILAAQEGLLIEDCIEFAYLSIKDRKGSLRNGVFVKEDNDEVKNQ